MKIGRLKTEKETPNLAMTRVENGNGERENPFTQKKREEKLQPFLKLICRKPQCLKITFLKKSYSGLFQTINFSDDLIRTVGQQLLRLLEHFFKHCVFSLKTQ